MGQYQGKISSFSLFSYMGSMAIPEQDNFNGIVFSNAKIHAAIMKWIDLREPVVTCIADGSHRNRPHPIALPAIFFYRACQARMMGCGAWVKISKAERIHICWNGGHGNNILAKLMALWGGLLAGFNMGIKEAHIFSDSCIVIDVVVGRSVLVHIGS